MILAYDGTDADAAERRRSAKEAHVALGNKMISAGNILFSTAVLNDDDQVAGSMRVMQFDTREQLDTWLETEPYVLENVWQEITIKKCRMGPAFEWMTLDPGEIRLE